MDRPKAHFEQIPVAIVRRIAHEFPAANEIGDPMHDDVSNHEDWRQVAQQVLSETDANKMVELVQVLIERYDKERHGKSGLTEG